MNVIDSYFAGIHNLNYRARSDLCSNFEKPLKRVKLIDILNINPNETEFSRSFIKSNTNVHPKENKKNEKHSNAKSEKSNLNCILRKSDDKSNFMKSLHSKSSSNLINNSYLRRSSRIRNKLENKISGSNNIHQSFVIVSPLKQYSHSTQNTKNNVQSQLTQFKNISNFKETNNDNNNSNNNQLNIEIKNSKIKNILEKSKDETSCTVSKESDLIFKNSSSAAKRGRPKINKASNLISDLSKEYHPEPLINNVANKRKKNLKTTGSAKKGRHEVKVNNILENGKDEALPVVSKELISVSNKELLPESLINNVTDKRKKNLKRGCAEKGSHEVNKDLDLTYTDKIDFTKSQVKLRGRRRKHCDIIDSKEQNVSSNIESISKNSNSDSITSLFEQFRDLDLTYSDKIDSSKLHVKKLTRRRKNCDDIDSKEQNVFNNTKSTSKNAKQTKNAANEVLSKVSKKKSNHESNENKGSRKTEKKDKNPSPLVQKNENVFDKKNKARTGTLKYLKERQNALRKLIVEENPADYVEVCKGKKNKALEDLLKIDENETLAIKTPNEKHKSKEPFIFTPRTALLDEWAKTSSSPSSSTPKNDFKSKGRCEQQGALNVLYHHLKNNPSKRRKPDWSKDADNKAKLPKKIQTSKSQKVNRQDVDNFMDLNLSKDEKEIFNCLSQKPSQDLNESSFDDYFNMSS